MAHLPEVAERCKKGCRRVDYSSITPTPSPFYARNYGIFSFYDIFRGWSNCVLIDVPKERDYKKYIGDLRYLALHFNAIIILIVFALCCKACADIPELAIDIELSAEMFLEHTHLEEYPFVYNVALCDSNDEISALLSDKDNRRMPLITNVVDCCIPDFLYHHTIDINDIYDVLAGTGKIHNFWSVWSRLCKEGDFLFCKSKLWIPNVDTDSDTFALPTKAYDMLIAQRKRIKAHTIW